MSDVDLLNPVPVDEARAWWTNLSTVFLGDPYDEDLSARRLSRWVSEWVPERTWGARAHGRWVATLATRPRTITVPGPGGATRELAADALTGVTVNPTHRRRGLLTAMMGQALTAAKERGDALSILIAAEWPIYGRFGYGPAAQSADYTYFPRQAGAAIAPHPGGAVRQVDAEELYRHAYPVFDAARRERPGQVDRSELWWTRSLGQGDFRTIGKPLHHVLHEGPDGPDGVLLWRPERDFELDGRMGTAEVEDLFAANPVAYRNLWAYLSSLDVIGEVTLHARPVDESARWLLRDGRALRQGYAGDDLWVRLLDVPAALSARAYAAAGRVVIEVSDGSYGYASGRFALESVGSGATCTPTTDDADLAVTVQALGSAYLGGYSLTALAAGGGVLECRSGSLARAAAMFATPLAPWTATGF